MEYMRTLLRDNELFRTYVTVSPAQRAGDPVLILWGLLLFCWTTGLLSFTLGNSGWVELGFRRFWTAPPCTQRACSVLHFQFVT